MTIPPIPGNGMGVPPLRIPVVTAPVSTGVPPIIGEEELQLPQGATPPQTGGLPREDAPISLAGRLEAGDVLPETTRLALALESATRAMQNGRADQVLSELDAVWSNQLASDSPWYLRTAALQLLGRMSDAEQVLRDAIAKLPRSAAMLYLLGVHTSYRGQVDAARLANEHALSLHPTEALLWLQRAALEQSAGMAGNAAAALEHVQTLEPTFPATSWLATLMRLGESRDRTTSPTPVLQRALERLTPAGVPVISDQPAPDATPAATPAVLETAVRYGLTLLESPTQSARTATQAAAPGDAMQSYGEMMARAAAQQPVPASAFPSWEALVVMTGLLVMAFVPPLRIPALLVTGGVTMLLVSRAMR